ncbi:MAG: hypothetical protein M3Q45_03010 [Chloroflexota bacterium]|nr:hypothetical protein [Chloroflexota bacterium]
MLYLVLRSFCHEGHQTCNPSIKTLMEILGLTDRRQLIGRVDEKGPKKRVLPGLIDVLQEHQLVTAEVRGEGPDLRYVFHVNLTPPLLTSDQLSRLPQSLQKKHEQLLTRVTETARKMAELKTYSPVKVKPTLTNQKTDGTSTIGASELETAPNIHEKGGVVQYHPPPGTVPPPPGTVPPKQHPINNTQLTTTGTRADDNNNRSDQTVNQSVVVVLHQQGISEKIAQRLAGRYSQERILGKIDYLIYLREHDPDKVKKPQGWLRKAIEEDYGPPDGYKSAAQRAAEAVAEQQREKARQRLEAQSAQRFQAEQARKGEEQAQKQQEEAERLAKLYEQYGTTAEERDVWQRVLAELEIKLSQAVFQGQLTGSALFTVREGEAIVGLKNHFTRDWVANRLADKIQRPLAKQLGVASIPLTFVSFQQVEGEREPT